MQRARLRRHHLLSWRKQAGQTLLRSVSQRRHFVRPSHLQLPDLMMGRTYEDAINIIESRRRQRRPDAAVANAMPETKKSSSSGTPDLRGTPSIAGMTEWLQMLGHTPEDINGMNVIHVAGTKGKGSTCAFIESFLRAHGRRTGFPHKTGLYTSPHLIDPEERIRINMRPLDRTLLAKYFFEVYDRLPQLRSAYDPSKELIERGPRYLQLWALLAFHVFLRERVDATIVETHNGGEYDATNVVEKPIVTAVTALGMDHIAQLGPTLENIAWHKAGIYKQGAAALSTPQDPSLAQVLRRRAADSDETVRFIPNDARLPATALQLEPGVQRKNASLALAAAEAFLSRIAPAGSETLDRAGIDAGVKQWSWPGRFQVLSRDRTTWFLDAAHNEMSVALAAEWFVEGGNRLCAADESPVRILIFAHINELRDAEQLLTALAVALRKHKAGLDHVVFTTYTESDGTSTPGKHDSSTFQRVWQGCNPGDSCQVWNQATVPQAMEHAQLLARERESSQILVTGSQHLVGPVLRILLSKPLD